MLAGLVKVGEAFRLHGGVFLRIDYECIDMEELGTNIPCLILQEVDDETPLPGIPIMAFNVTPINPDTEVEPYE